MLLYLEHAQFVTIITLVGEVSGKGQAILGISVDEAVLLVSRGFWCILPWGHCGHFCFVSIFGPSFLEVGERFFVDNIV
jgi:hypothetical protein